MKVIETDLPGVVVIEPRVFEDERGEFFESWNKPRWAERGMDLSFVQSNVSRSLRGVLRGLHYQWPQPQGKLVSVLEGEVYDVAVDIRRGSPDFGRATAALLSAGNRRQMWIPEGFAHGFQTLTDDSEVFYQMSEFYEGSSSRGVRWNDLAFAIEWPEPTQRIISVRDQQYPDFIE